MITSREEMLRVIRRTLGRDGPLPDERIAELSEQLDHPQPRLIPKRAQVSHRERVRLFVQMAKESEASVEEVRTLRAIPGAAAGFLKRHNLPARLVVAPDPALAEIQWDTRPSIEVRHGRAEPKDRTSVTGAFAGIAETGTLVLISGPGSPTTLNLLPDNHLVVLHTDQILGSYEEGWSKLREHQRGKNGSWQMPRSVNYITGPSRSADIEQTLLMGAHGPRRLHILVVRG
ncbi:MAG: LutC/YkgG family protein [Alphaproteobacteria bacterium]